MLSAPAGVDLQLSTVQVDTTRNTFDAAFTESSDDYAAGVITVGFRRRSIKLANRSLAWRAATSNCRDITTLSNSILRDKSSGNEEMRAATFHDTLMVSAAYSQMIYLAQRDVEQFVGFLPRPRDLLAFAKHHHPSLIPVVILALFVPLTLPAGFLIDLLCFPTEYRIPEAFYSQSAHIRAAFREGRGRFLRLFVDRVRPVRVVKVGPTAGKPHFWSAGPLELARSLATRSGRIVPEVREAALRIFDDAAIRSVQTAYPRGIDWTLPIDVPALVMGQGWPRGKTE